MPASHLNPATQHALLSPFLAPNQNQHQHQHQHRPSTPTMPRLHNADVSSVRRRGPRGGLGSGGGTSGGSRRRPGSIGAVGTTPGLLSTDHASTSARASTATTGGKPVVSTGGNPTNSNGDIAAQGIGGQVSDAIGASAMTASGGSTAPLHTATSDDDLMGADLSLGGVRKSLDATFRHSESPSALNLDKDNAPATAAGAESSENAHNDDGDVKANAAPEHDDDMEFHASQYDDALTNVEAANDDEPAAHDGTFVSAQTPKDGSSGQDIGSSTTTPATQQEKEEAVEAAAINTNTSRPSSRRRRRKVRKSGASASADEDTGSAPVSSGDEGAEKGKDSGADDKQVTDALAAVMATDDGGTTNDKEGARKEDGNELAKKGSDADTWVYSKDVAAIDATNASGDDDDDDEDGDKATHTNSGQQQQQQKEPPKKKKTSRPNKSKRRIVGSRVIECEKAPPSSVPPGAVAHSPHPQESAAKKRRKLSVGFDNEEIATTKDITATPANKVKRGQPPMPDSGISLNSVASTPCAAGTPGNESAPDPGTPADVAHIQGLFDQLNEQVRRKQEEHDAEKKSIHQKWQRKHTKNKERHEAKIRQYQIGYDNLSKEFDKKFAQVNRERAEEKIGFEKKEKMLSERIEKLATELEKKNSKLERWRGRMQEAKQMHAEAWEIDGKCKQLKISLDAREGRLKSLEEDYESRNKRLRKHKQELQKKERELARREREMEVAIRRKIEAEMAEKQSLRSIGHSVAQKLIGFGGGGSGSDTDVAAGDSLHQQRLLLDQRELQLDDRERDLDARESALKGKNIQNGPSSPSKMTPTKNHSAMSRYAYDDSLFDSPASRTRARLSGGSSSSFDSAPSNDDVGGKRKRAPQTPTRTSPRKKKVKVVRSAPPAVQGGGGKKRPALKATKKKKLVVMDASDSDSSEDF